MNGRFAREAVRRRALRVGLEKEGAGGRRALRHSGLRAAQKLIDYATKHYASLDTTDIKMLRRRMVRAGIYDAHGPAYFFLARAVAAVVLAFAAFFGLPMFGFHGKASFWLFLIAAGVIGYLLPSIYLDRMIAKKRMEHHQAGFPDFTDLLVVCADAGLSMEASLDRVGRRTRREELPQRGRETSARRRGLGRVRLAASYDRLRRFDLADRAYAEAIRIVGLTVQILNDQGFSYMLRGDYGRAHRLLEQARARDPENPYVQANLRLHEESAHEGKAVQ